MKYENDSLELNCISTIGYASVVLKVSKQNKNPFAVSCLSQDLILAIDAINTEYISLSWESPLLVIKGGERKILVETTTLMPVHPKNKVDASFTIGKETLSVLKRLSKSFPASTILGTYTCDQGAMIINEAGTHMSLSVKDTVTDCSIAIPREYIALLADIAPVIVDRSGQSSITVHSEDCNPLYTITVSLLNKSILNRYRVGFERLLAIVNNTKRASKVILSVADLNSQLEAAVKIAKTIEQSIDISIKKNKLTLDIPRRYHSNIPIKCENFTEANFGISLRNISGALKGYEGDIYLYKDAPYLHIVDDNIHTIVAMEKSSKGQRIVA